MTNDDIWYLSPYCNSYTPLVSNRTMLLLAILSNISVSLALVANRSPLSTTTTRISGFSHDVSRSSTFQSSYYTHRKSSSPLQLTSNAATIKRRYTATNLYATAKSATSSPQTIASRSCCMRWRSFVGIVFANRVPRQYVSVFRYCGASDNFLWQHANRKTLHVNRESHGPKE